jgi:aminopeptidase N
VETPSLTRDEALARAELIAVEHYDISVDLTDLPGGDEFRAVSTISFTCKSPGGSTFVDCAAEVTSATLNGSPIFDEAISDGRIRLDDVESVNTLVVASVQRETTGHAGVRRCVDPSDKLVYLWTTFEPDDARVAWACFDQPDLKAPFAFVVTAPQDWIVTSNSDAPRIEQLPDARRWTFPATPHLSTYVPVVNAGPFYELRRQVGGYDLGLLARQSLARCLDRDADELFALTAAGLEFFGEQFGFPFPQETYDQVFVPDMGGAMENWGCVTWSDGFIYRSTPTPQEREERASVLLHEMAHMWFGDLVTMKWWDDLWLNESFAEWACCWAATNATEFTDTWSSFLASDKLLGYSADMAPATTHPIRQPARDVAEAAASFDRITYCKGASVLKQLVAYVGEDTFVAALREYFAQHAWGNTELSDLIAALEHASGHDLSAWTEGWLDMAGTDRLTLEVEQGGAAVLTATGPDGAAPRPHRLNIGVYDDTETTLTRRGLIDVTIDGGSARVSDSGLDGLVLVNDEDWTFASSRTAGPEHARIFERAHQLPNSVSRAVAVTTAWDMLVRGEYPTAGFVRCVTNVLEHESADSVVEPFLRLATTAAERWSPDTDRDEMLDQVASVCMTLADNPARRTVALRGLASTAVTTVQLGRLRNEAADDVDLRWRALIRFAELGEYDQEDVDAADRADPNPEAWTRALAVKAAQPDADAKRDVWDAMVERREVPMEAMREVANAFWRPTQAHLYLPFAERYRELIPELHKGGMLAALPITSAMLPRYGVDDAFADSLVDAANDPEVSPLVSSTVIEIVDTLKRQIAARTA